MTAPLRRSGALVATIKRSCENKRRYADDVAARGAGQYLSEANSVKLYIYPCPYCKGWHLTSKRQYRPDRAVTYQYPPTPR